MILATNIQSRQKWWLWWWWLRRSPRWWDWTKWILAITSCIPIMTTLTDKGRPRKLDFFVFRTMDFLPFLHLLIYDHGPHLLIMSLHLQNHDPLIDHDHEPSLDPHEVDPEKCISSDNDCLLLFAISVHIADKTRHFQSRKWKHNWLFLQINTNPMHFQTCRHKIQFEHSKILNMSWPFSPCMILYISNSNRIYLNPKQF